MVLQIMVWFGSILSRFSTHLLLLGNPWLVHVPTFVFLLQSKWLLLPLSPNQCLLACCKATSLRSPSTVPHIFMLPQQSPRGATEVQLEGIIAAALFWNHTPIPFPTLLQSYLCIRILQYPHTLHLQVAQLSANDICCFWHQSLQSKAAQQQWEGKTDIVVKWWPSFLHFRWDASTLKFPILHIKKVSPKNTSSRSGSASGRAAAAETEVSSCGIWCSFKQISRLQREQSLFHLSSMSKYCKNTTMKQYSYSQLYFFVVTVSFHTEFMYLQRLFTIVIIIFGRLFVEGATCFHFWGWCHK